MRGNNPDTCWYENIWELNQPIKSWASTPIITHRWRHCICSMYRRHLHCSACDIQMIIKKRKHVQSRIIKIWYFGTSWHLLFDVKSFLQRVHYFWFLVCFFLAGGMDKSEQGKKLSIHCRMLLVCWFPVQILVVIFCSVSHTGSRF